MVALVPGTCSGVSPNNALEQTREGYSADTLRRIGDLSSLRILNALGTKTESQADAMSDLCEQHYRLRETRWDLLERYLEWNGARLVPNSSVA